VICALASIHNLGSSFTPCWKMGRALLTIFLSWCANTFVSSTNMLLQSALRPTHSNKQVTYCSYLVLLSELLLSMLGVVGRLGFAVPIRLGLVGFSEVIRASCSVGASGVVPASFSVGAGGMDPPSFSVGAGGIVLASFSGGVVLPSSDSVLNRPVRA